MRNDWPHCVPRLILASASPRRKMLMRQAGILCEVKPCDADETVPEGTMPGDMVRIVSARKAERAAKAADDCVIIAADTVVCISDRVLGKPADADDACAMLRALQGRKHTVYTGVTLVKIQGGSRETVCFTETADVFMRALTDDEINAYVATGEPLDKAGAYGVQEKGAVLVERVEGDYFTVVGLPLSRLCVALKQLGADITAGWA